MQHPDQKSREKFKGIHGSSDQLRHAMLSAQYGSFYKGSNDKPDEC